MKQIIEKAIENGFDFEGAFEFPVENFLFFGSYFKEDDFSRIYYYRDLYLSHPFAKAFFGTQDGRRASIVEGCALLRPEWEFALMEMVLMTDEEAIKYMEQHLEGEEKMVKDQQGG